MWNTPEVERWEPEGSYMVFSDLLCISTFWNSANKLEPIGIQVRWVEQREVPNLMSSERPLLRNDEHPGWMGWGQVTWSHALTLRCQEAPSASWQQKDKVMLQVVFRYDIDVQNRLTKDETEMKGHWNSHTEGVAFGIEKENCKLSDILWLYFILTIIMNSVRNPLGN